MDADAPGDLREPELETEIETREESRAPSVPARLGEFEIVRELGRGGMGVVYEAHQRSLARRVALKLLPPGLALASQAGQRFELEARAAAQLKHRNIVGVHAIGEDNGQRYYAMELVDGVPLDRILGDLRAGRWSPAMDSALVDDRAGLDPGQLEADSRTGGRVWADAVASLIAEVAEALAYAHDRGVIHRDIKPANLILSREGHVCITDFGLARVAQEPGLTSTGAMIGTPAYMSPEQVTAGRFPLDHRTDVYSLGAVLYELLTLRRPIDGASHEELLSNVLSSPPVPLRTVRPGIPRDLESICLKALEKLPDHRYETAEAMARDLREYLAHGLVAAKPLGPVRRALRFARRHPNVAAATAGALAVAGLSIGTLPAVRQAVGLAPPPPTITRLAVLPFRNASGDPAQDLHADGITEMLIADLGRIRSLTVIAQRAVNQYKDTDKSVAEIADELDVDAIVEGSVLRSEGRVRVTASLVDADTGGQLWGGHFQRSQRDVFLLQGEVAQAIAGMIRVELTPEEEALLANNRVVDPEAHEAYLIGKSFVLKWQPESVTKGIRYLEEALALDPEFALAHAGLANAHVFSASMGGGWRPPTEAVEPARRAATTALELDESLAEAHVQMGAIAYMFDWDAGRAERELQRAIELNPSLPDARTNYAVLLGASGRYVEALDQIRIAIELDPLNTWYRLHLARAYFISGDYDRASEEYDQILDLDPSPYFQVLVNSFRADIDIKEGRLGDAIEAKERAVELDGRKTPDMISSLGYVYGLAGRRDEALALVEDLDRIAASRYVSPVNYARLYAGVGDLDAAFRHLEIAYETRCGYLMVFPTAGYFETLRADPRGRDLLRRIGLPSPTRLEAELEAQSNGHRRLVAQRLPVVGVG